MSHREQRRLYISSSEVCVLLSPRADRDTRRAGRDFSLVWGGRGAPQRVCPLLIPCLFATTMEMHTTAKTRARTRIGEQAQSVRTSVPLSTVDQPRLDLPESPPSLNDFLHNLHAFRTVLECVSCGDGQGSPQDPM